MIWKPVPGLELESDYAHDVVIVNGVRVAAHFFRSFFAGEIKEAHVRIERKGDNLEFTSLPCGRDPWQPIATRTGNDDTDLIWISERAWPAFDLDVHELAAAEHWMPGPPRPKGAKP